MTVDREQIRRDAEAVVGLHGDRSVVGSHCLALLADLEQADLRVELFQEEAEAETAKRGQAEARLAAVPALVEKVRGGLDSAQWLLNNLHNRHSDAWLDYAAAAKEDLDTARDALAAYEQAAS